MATKVVIPARFSYLYVWEPKIAPGATTPKYSVALLIKKSDTALVAQIQAAIKEAYEGGVTKFGGKLPTVWKNPLRDGDAERPEDENYTGMWFINANSNDAPEVFSRYAGPDGKPALITDKKQVYSGCYGKASVNFYAFNTNGNKGVAAGLNGIQKLEDGEPLSGGGSSAGDFDTDSPDPLA